MKKSSKTCTIHIENLLQPLQRKRNKKMVIKTKQQTNKEKQKGKQFFSF